MEDTNETNISIEDVCNVIRKGGENQKTYIKGLRKIFIVHENKKLLNTFREQLSQNQSFGPEIYIFDNVDGCFTLINGTAAENQAAKFIVFVGGQLVCDLVSRVHNIEQFQVIFIMNKPPFTKEERETMNLYSKVKYITDLQTATSFSLFDCVVPSKDLFSEPIEFSCTNGDECIEPSERSFKQYDKNFIIRYSMLLCLQHAVPYPTSKAELIELLERENLASSNQIKKFQEDYSKEKALHFYTRDEFIFGVLNRALRTSNFLHLFRFRFVLQHICTQLCEIMPEKSQDDIFTVYRGQICSQYEIADLTTAYANGAGVTINSFFSTSKERDVAEQFLWSANSKMCDSDRFPAIFKITVRNQDISKFLPIADISQFSQYPEEEEVLFAPGQMFTISHFNTIIEMNLNIYLFEMTLAPGFKEALNTVNDNIQRAWSTEMNDPFLYLGTLLVEDNRLEQAKEYYYYLLSQNYDKTKKSVCYQNLMRIAELQNDTNEARNMYEKLNEVKFNRTTSLTTNDEFVVDKEDGLILRETVEQIKKLEENELSDPSMSGLFPNVSSEGLNNDFEQLSNMTYNMVLMLVKSKVYDISTHYLESMLASSQIMGPTGMSSSLKAKFHLLLGLCNRELKVNDTSLKYYELALEAKIHLSTLEYIEATIGIGKVLEATSRYEEALHRYTEVAEIYQSDPNLGSSEERHDMEESIHRVITNLISI